MKTPEAIKGRDVVEFIELDIPSIKYDLISSVVYLKIRKYFLETFTLDMVIRPDKPKLDKSADWGDISISTPEDIHTFQQWEEYYNNWQSKITVDGEFFIDIQKGINWLCYEYKAGKVHIICKLSTIKIFNDLCREVKIAEIKATFN